eukprot:136169_1
MSEFDVSGQLAVITGAAEGIGRAIAIKLGLEGCNLALVDIQEEILKQTATHLQSLCPSIKVHSFTCDVTDIDALKVLVGRIKSTFGAAGIQLLFNNVGIAGVGSTLYTDIPKLQKELNVNLWGVVYGTRVFLPMLLANDPKTQCYIVNTGSIAGIETGFSWYSVTKHAVIAYSETVREELKRLHPKQNILVTTLVPGFVNTNIRHNSEIQLGDTNKRNEMKSSLSKQNQMIEKTQIDVTELANIVYEALKNKKVVVPSHLDWHEAVIKDRARALLTGTPDNKSNMRKAVRATMRKSKL